MHFTGNRPAPAPARAIPSALRRLAGPAIGVLVVALAAATASADGEHHSGAAAMPRTPAPPGARAYIISPENGAKVHSPVTVRFGLSGMGVAPAGVEVAHTGHHHLIVDAPLPPEDKPIPSDEHHIHFGKGQTEVTLDLPPGTHTLQLLLADQNHIPHDPPVVSQLVTITVVGN